MESTPLEKEPEVGGAALEAAVRQAAGEWGLDQERLDPLKLKETVEIAKGELVAKQEQLEGLSQEPEPGELEQKLEELEAKHEQAGREREEKQNELSQQRKKEKEAKERIEALQQERDKLEAEQKSLDVELGELQQDEAAARKRLEGLKGEVIEAVQATDLNQAGVFFGEDQVREVENEEIEQRGVEIEAVKTRLEATKQRLERETAFSKELRDETVKGIDKALEKVGKYEDELRRLSEIKSKEVELQQQRKAKQERVEAIGYVSGNDRAGEIGKAESQRMEANLNVEKLGGNIAQLTGEMEALKTTLETMKPLLEKGREERQSKLEQQRTELERKIKELTERIQVLEEQSIRAEWLELGQQLVEVEKYLQENPEELKKILEGGPQVFMESRPDWLPEPVAKILWAETLRERPEGLPSLSKNPDERLSNLVGVIEESAVELVEKLEIGRTEMMDERREAIAAAFLKTLGKGEGLDDDEQEQLKEALVHELIGEEEREGLRKDIRQALEYYQSEGAVFTGRELEQQLATLISEVGGENLTEDAETVLGEEIAPEQVIEWLSRGAELVGKIREQAQKQVSEFNTSSLISHDLLSSETDEDELKRQWQAGLERTKQAFKVLAYSFDPETSLEETKELARVWIDKLQPLHLDTAGTSEEMIDYLFGLVEVERNGKLEAVKAVRKMVDADEELTNEVVKLEKRWSKGKVPDQKELRRALEALRRILGAEEVQAELAKLDSVERANLIASLARGRLVPSSTRASAASSEQRGKAIQLIKDGEFQLQLDQIVGEFFESGDSMSAAAKMTELMTKAGVKQDSFTQELLLSALTGRTGEWLKQWLVKKGAITEQEWQEKTEEERAEILRAAIKASGKQGLKNVLIGDPVRRLLGLASLALEMGLTVEKEAEEAGRGK